MMVLMITAVVVLAIIILAARIQIFQKERAEIKKKILEKAMQGQKIILAKDGSEQTEPKKHIEVRIAEFLRKNERVRFTKAEIEKEIVRNERDSIGFYRALIAVTYYQRRDGYGIEADYSKSKLGEFYYYYEKPKE